MIVYVVTDTRREPVAVASSPEVALEAANRKHDDDEPPMVLRAQHPRDERMYHLIWDTEWDDYAYAVLPFEVDGDE